MPFLKIKNIVYKKYMIIIMNSIKVYKYLLLVLIILILLIGAIAITRGSMIKQIKVIVFWYLLILELNLINIYSVLSFYEKNKTRKGPKGYKGIVGPRGLKGSSVLCSSCGLSGNDVTKYSRSFGIEHPKIKPGRCIFPFMQGYVYRNEPEREVDPPFGIPKPNGINYKGWCATEVNNQFEPVTIGFYDSNLSSQIESEAELSKMRSQYLQSQMGILDIQLVYGNTIRQAKQMFKSRKLDINGYNFMDADLNEGTGGKYVHMCVRRGAEGRGVVAVKVRYFKNKAEADRDAGSYDEAASNGFKVVNNSEPINLNYDSGMYSKSEDVPVLYLYIKKGDTNFIKDIMVINDSDEIPAGFVPIRYDSDNIPGDSSDANALEYDIRDVNNDIVDLNRGTHSNTAPRLMLLTRQNTNIVAIDTAFTYTDGALYMFVADKFYKFSVINPNKSIDLSDGYPKPLQEKWGRLPNLTGKRKTSDVLKVDNCSKFDGVDNEQKCERTDKCFFDAISKRCEALSIYDAAYVDQNGETFLFKGQFVYKYDAQSMKIASGYPKLISAEIPGAPSSIDAIFVWAKDNSTYIFKGNMHYKVDPTTKKVARGYPKNNKNRWSGFPDMINAIFSYHTFITRNETKLGKVPKTNNHTYIISQDDIYYIDPNTDEVEKAGNLNDIFTGLEGLSSSPVDFDINAQLITTT
jgi:hypothetical protein